MANLDIKEIFNQALDHAPGQERADYLARACQGNEPLRSTIEEMLRDHERLGNFLATGAHERAPAIQPPGVLAQLSGSLCGFSSVLLKDAEAESALSPVVQPSSREMPAAGRRSSRFQVFGEIARGGMGAVLKARDPDLGRELAVKVLLEAHRDNPVLVRRFVEEAQVGGQLQHPGIVPVYELGVDAASRPYFAMKLIRGQTFAALLQSRPSPSRELGRLLSILEQVCQTVAYAHARGVIHRDLKPANIMVGAFGEVHVVDWGLAKVLASGGVADERPASQSNPGAVATVRSGSADARSESGSILGTPAYMPPEQARGDVESLDERADVFALGAILCEVLTGSPPYTGNRAEVLLQARDGNLEGAFRRLAASGSDPELVALARQCLAPSPNERPREAGPVALALSAYLVSADERARRAERDAAAAKARAAADRRARHLSVATACVFAFASLGVGTTAVMFVQARRGQQLAEAKLVQQDLVHTREMLEAEKSQRAQDGKLAEVALAAGLKGNVIIDLARAAPASEADRWVQLLSAAATSAERIASAANVDVVRQKAIELRDTLRQTESVLRKRANLPPQNPPRTSNDQPRVPGPNPDPNFLEGTRMTKRNGCSRCVMILTITLGGLASPAIASPDPIEVCSERMKVIHKALVAYEAKHHQWPDHLSDLVPEFLPSQAALRDPADPGTGGLGSNMAHEDPKFRVSYSYERCADPSNGLASPAGPFPKSDLPDQSWGSWRLVNGHQETFFGDQVPLFRCFFHRPAEDEREPGHDLVLNLTPSGRVYRSDFDWQHHPDSAAFLLRTLARDLTQGPGHMKRRWLFFRLNEYFQDCQGLDSNDLKPVGRVVADGLLAMRDQIPGEQRWVCFLAANLRRRVGDFEGVHSALAACKEYSASEWSPIVEAQLKGEAYHAQKDWANEILTYEWLLHERPDVRPYMNKLAAAYEAAGNKLKAEEWKLKADPGARLVGKPAPDFRLPMLSGDSVTLAEARRGKKAVLLNFWFRGCEPCRLEFPHLQKTYDAFKAQGLEIIAVDHGDTLSQVREFVADTFAFPIALGRDDQDKANAIFADYHVSVFPTNYLIDGEGRVVWRGIGFGAELKANLAQALAKLGIK